jgi:hypothetical protein
MVILLLFFFTVSALVPSTVWQDMSKIADLIEHYEEHKAANANLSFWSFMALHYGADFQAHQSAHDHSKLPLKNTHTTFVNVLIVGISEAHTFNLDVYTELVLPEKKRVLSTFSQSFMSRNLTDIWQPPRPC